MATGWVKSMQCKYAAIDDVVHRHHHHRRYHRHESHSNHHRYHRHESDSKHTTTASTSCRKTVDSLKGSIIETTKQIKKSKTPGKPPPPPPPPSLPVVLSRIRHNPPSPVSPVLTELSEGHQSRNVVEIIFHTGWSPKAFMGRMEMVFKIQNGTRTVTRFEEYRDAVKSRADVAGSVLQDDGESEDLSRCIADGNEMMRFQCLGPTNGGPVCDAAGGAWGVNAVKGAAICTFSGSRGAHDAAGGGNGRRAMLVCRVIAGRVCKSKRLGLDSLLEDRLGFDSVSREDDELLVFDSRAVLPCFLVIYKL